MAPQSLRRRAVEVAEACQLHRLLPLVAAAAAAAAAATAAPTTIPALAPTPTPTPTPAHWALLAPAL